jgi:hypothetical protein
MLSIVWTLNNKKKKKKKKDSVITAAIKELEDEPKTIAKVWSCPDWPRWKEAMDHKIKTLEGART